MSELRDVCAALEAIDGDILRMAHELHAKARSYSQASERAAAGARDAGGEGAAALARTAAALAAAARHCAQVAAALTGASREGQAYIRRTVGAGSVVGAVAPAPAGAARDDGNSLREGPLDRVRDAAEIRRRAALSRQKEDEHPDWGHGFREHVDVTKEELARRAATGINARGDKNKIPEHATRFSEAASVITTDLLWRMPKAQQRRNEIEANLREGRPARPSFTVRAPLSLVLGPDWRDDVYGRSSASGGLETSQWRADSEAVVTFRKQGGTWYQHTCYPQVEPKREQ
jgi:hypothetical protein